LGSGQEVSIQRLAYTISKIVGYDSNRIHWDTTKQDGQMRKRLNTTKMREYLNVPITRLEDGLFKTIEWYKETYCD